MPLKIHMLASVAPGGREAFTACGEPIFKSAQGAPLAFEWEARRRIGACYAVPEREFYRTPKGYCAKCIKVYAEG